MGFWSSVGSFVSSVASAAVSVISSAVSAVVEKISPIISMGENIIKAVVGVAQALLTSLGILKPEENLDDMADRMKQAAEQGIVPEKYEKFEDYVQAIRDFKLDPEKTQELSSVEKLVMGLGFATLALESKFKGSESGNLANIWVMTAKNPEYFTADRVISVLSKTTDMKSVKDYFDGKLNSKDAEFVEKKLFDAEKDLSPNKSDDAIFDLLDAAKNKYRSS